MIRLFIPLLIFTFHFQSFAKQNSCDISSFEIKKGNPTESGETCYVPTLSAQQEYIIHEIRRIHLKETSHTLTKIEKNKKAYLKILLDKKIPTSTRADEAADKLFSAKRNLLKQQRVYFHAVFYKVLLVDQRKYITRCL